MSWRKVGIGIVIVGALGWVGWYVTRPMPGIRMEDQGRGHVTAEKVAFTQYNSNPPTSGQHLETWVKAGIYDTPQSEGELIHSLEHGYVIISYNCNVHLTSNIKYQISNIKFTNQKLNIVKPILAHEEESNSSDQSSPSASLSDPTIATGSPSTSFRTGAVNESDGCKALVKNFTELASKKKLWKLILVPRPQLDTTVALTAWNYIDKFDHFDARPIERFIDFHRDQGPEKTME